MQLVKLQQNLRQVMIKDAEAKTAANTPEQEQG
jgi:hypothetical protein